MPDLVLQLAATLGALGTIGGGLWWLLVPRIREWLRREVAKPVHEIHTQVTPNGGDSNHLSDRIVRVEALGEKLQQLMVNHLEDHAESDLKRPR